VCDGDEARTRLCLFGFANKWTLSIKFVIPQHADGAECFMPACFGFCTDEAQLMEHSMHMCAVMIQLQHQVRGRKQGLYINILIELAELNI